MIDELPAAPDPVTDTPAVFSQKAAAFVLAQKAMVPQMNATAASMNSAANGGAFSIPYKFLTSTVNNGTAAGGIISFLTSQILVDTKSSAGLSVTNALFAAGASSSAIKSYIRITNASDPSKWATYSVSSYAQNGGGLYGVFNVTLIDRTSATPFANNDAVILSITPNGDKGDVGPANTYPTMVIRDEKATNTAAQSLSGNTWNIRTLNTLKSNTIATASLGSNAFTLPVGTYWFIATVPGTLTKGHQARLYNMSDAAVQEVGTSEQSYDSIPNTTRSVIRSVFTLTAPKTFRIEHWVILPSGGNPTGGQPTGSGQVEVYTEVMITKVG